MTDLAGSSFYGLLPPNLRDNTAKALSHAADRQMARLAAYIAKTLIYVDVDHLDEALCDFLALSFDIKAYDFGFALHIKRRMIKIALDAYSRNGTAAIVNEMVGAVADGHARAAEWWEYGGEPHCFRLTIYDTGGPILIPIYDQLRETAMFYKPVRSWLDKLILIIEAVVQLIIGIRCRVAMRARLSVWDMMTVRLDGSHDLDGNWILSSLWNRGPHFERFALRHRKPLPIPTRMDLAFSGGVAVGHRRIPVLSLFALFAHYSVFGLQTVRLDGSRTLDGNWILSSAFTRGPSFPRFALRHAKRVAPRLPGGLASRWEARGCAQDAPRFSRLAVRAAHGVFGLHIVYLDGGQHLDGLWRLAAEFERGGNFARMALKTAVQAPPDISAQITRDSMWRLDGSMVMDGSHRLNADIITTDL